MLREKLYWEDTVFRLESLVVFRQVLQDDVVQSFLSLCRTIAYDAEKSGLYQNYYDFLSRLLVRAEDLGLSGNIFRKFFIHLFLFDENIFTLACERNEPVGKRSLYQYAMRDINNLHYFCEFDIKNLCENIGYGEDITKIINNFYNENPYLEEVENAKNPDDKMKALLWHYERMGAGKMACCRMFNIDENNKLSGISKSDTVTFSDIIGFEWQKEMIRNNTEAFLAGQPANNVLLSGSRGNGKSSCVKALVNQYHDKGLRLIEVQKDQAPALPGLMKELVNRGKYFIIFMDDLSFEHFETQYKYLKSLLEGSAGLKPKNVLFYATSNRRHIIRESWGDRNDKPGAVTAFTPVTPADDEEIHLNDTLNEKLSLFDRFGITVTFPNLSQDEYINVVMSIAKKNNIVVDTGFLKTQAVQWALTQKSMSGRTARQFINHIQWEINK